MRSRNSKWLRSHSWALIVEDYWSAVMLNKFKDHLPLDQIKNRISFFIKGNSEEYEAVVRAELFIKKLYLLNFAGFDEYRSRELSYKRMAIVLVLKLVQVMTAIRYGISLFRFGSSFESLTSNSSQVLGNKTIISLILCLASIILLSANVLVYFFELTGQLKSLDMIYEFKHKCLEVSPDCLQRGSS